MAELVPSLELVVVPSLELVVEPEAELVLVLELAPWQAQAEKQEVTRGLERL